MIFNEVTVPHTHNLDELLRLCVEINNSIDISVEEVVQLNPYAVELRYDVEFWPDLTTTEKAMGIVRRVRDSVKRRIPNSD